MLEMNDNHSTPPTDSDKKNYWSVFNERIKFFFDSLRNLTISIGILKAGQYISSIYIAENNNSPSIYLITYMGYLLVGLTIMHFIIWTFISFPTAKSLGYGTRNPYVIQIYLSLIFICIVVGLFKYEIKF